MIHFRLGGPRPARPPNLHRHVGQPFPTPDAILLCSFGLDGTGTRTHRQLRTALRSVGYVAPLARHLILISPLLRRLPGSRYQLRQFEREPEAAASQRELTP